MGFQKLVDSALSYYLLSVGVEIFIAPIKSALILLFHCMELSVRHPWENEPGSIQHVSDKEYSWSVIQLRIMQRNLTIAASS